MHGVSIMCEETGGLPCLWSGQLADALFMSMREGMGIGVGVG